MEASKSLSKSRLHRIPSFRSESDAEIALVNEHFRFPPSTVAASNDAEPSRCLRIAIFRRERLRKTTREALQARTRKSSSTSRSGSRHGHQRSLSDTICESPQMKRHQTTAVGSSKANVPKTTSRESKSPSIAEAYVVHRPVAEGLLDIRTLQLRAHPLYVTVPLQVCGP